ncbi:hypothetical protein BJ742DRAFT_764408 [Cladochytrium replicatum]|nr:hypothetical protein BJ742DRAFT_764408 [Cladochytrium replicatum]
MLHAAKAPSNLWMEAFLTAISHSQYHSSFRSCWEKSPYELLTEHCSTHLLVWGCSAFCHVPTELRHKHDPKAVAGRFIG